MFCFLADTLTINAALPLAPFMVQHFFHFLPSQQSTIGYYSGLLASSYTIGQICTGPFWGAASDKHGRKPILLFGLVSTAILMVAFGLSTSFEAALTFRFLQGACSGNVIVARSYMADITDSTNEAQGFALLGAIFGLGGIAGPWLAGVLSFPSEQYPSVFRADGLFATHPFLLPCAVISVVAALDALVACLFLPESIQLSIAAEKSTTTNTTKENEEEEEEAQSRTKKEQDSENGENELFMDPTQGPMSSPLFRLVCATFGLFALVYFAFNEVFPVWARTPQSMGGLALSSSTIGTIQGIGLD
jgi:MFS family permease